MQNTDIIPQNDSPLSAADITKQINLIQDVMAKSMKDGQHYGKIPGCGDKPTLLKPGAEKLSLLFRLRPVIDNDRDIRIVELPNNHREVFVYCHIMNANGVELATGIGSSTTMESKHRYRGGERIGTGQPVPKGYWDAKKAGDTAKMKELIGQGMGVAKIDGAWQIAEIGEKMENPDIADTYNTVLKMAKKRAYVDGILSATAASDIFTQDIEDMKPEDLGNTSSAKPLGGKPPISSPQSTDDAPMNAVDIVALAKADVGAKMNVGALLMSSKKSEDKKPHQYAVVDIMGSPTVTILIKVFGDYIDIKPGSLCIFKDVEVQDYQGKKQYIAKGVSNAS